MNSLTDHVDMTLHRVLNTFRGLLCFQAFSSIIHILLSAWALIIPANETQMTTLSGKLALDSNVFIFFCLSAILGGSERDLRLQWDTGGAGESLCHQKWTGRAEGAQVGQHVWDGEQIIKMHMWEVCYPYISPYTPQSVEPLKTWACHVCCVLHQFVWCSLALCFRSLMSALGLWDNSAPPMRSVTAMTHHLLCVATETRRKEPL